MSALLKELSKKEWVIVRFTKASINEAVSSYLKEVYKIENEPFYFYISEGIDVCMSFENDNMDNFFDKEDITSYEFIANAIDYSLGIENTSCAIFPDDDTCTDYFLVEMPKSKLI